MNIRAELSSDIEKIWEINRDAFGTEDEANLVNALRSSGCTYLSLVAEIEDEIAGYILFTPVELSGNKNNLKIAGLAPMAVSSRYQNKGIGSKLVKAGLDRCKSSGFDAVVVLGHPNYYPKFGFTPAVKFGIKSEYDVPDEAFMILELVQGTLKNHKGTIKYHEAFNSV